MAAIALPNLLGQVAKGRQSEAKNNLGAINRAQQAYRLERATFTTIGNLPVEVNGEYYSFSGGDDDPVFADHEATALTNYVNDINDYASGVVQTADGEFSAVICESTDPTTDNAAAQNNSGEADCSGGSPVN